MELTQCLPEPRVPAEGIIAARRFAKGYVDCLLNAEPKMGKSFDDLHMLFGAMCALSELQTALPGEYLSTVPLKIVLDRRPFI